jgi:signal transduction histidine kinase
MRVLLGFAPFFVFALLSRFAPASVSLWAAAAVSAALVLREKLCGRSTKILEAGTFVLFALLGLYTSLTHGAWDVPTVRAVVDGGLLFIIVLSLLIRRPFTLQYARERVPATVQNSPSFIRTNYIITMVWALAMAIIVVADLAMHFATRLPVQVEVVVIVGALGGAFWFSKWYPETKRRQHASALQ